MDFIIFVLLHFLVVLSPGPSFIGMTNFALNYGFKKTLPYILGLGLGNIIISSVAVFGILKFIFSSLLFNGIFYMAGGIFLIFFAIKTFKSKNTDAADIKQGFAFWTGFGVEILNPKSVLFTASLFAIVIKPETHMLFKGFILIWFIIFSAIYELSIIWAVMKFRSGITQYAKYINIIFSALLILFGIKFLLNSVSLLFN